MNGTVLTLLVLLGIASLAWAVLSITKRPVASEAAPEVEPEVRRSVPRSLKMPSNQRPAPAQSSMRLRREPAVSEAVAKANELLASLREPTPVRPKARLLHGAPDRPVDPSRDLAWVSVDKETVTFPDPESEGEDEPSDETAQ